MTTRVELRLPPLKFVVAGVISLVLLVHLVTIHTSDAYARHASIESLRTKLGLSSDGMPVVWRGGEASRAGAAAKTGGVQDWEGEAASASLFRWIHSLRIGSGLERTGRTDVADLVARVLLSPRRQTRLARTLLSSSSRATATSGTC